MPNRALRERLGISDLRGFLAPILQSLIVGLIFVGVLLVGYRSPHPRNVDVDIVGPSPVVAAMARQLAAADPGAYVLHLQPSLDAGLQRLRRGSTYGVLDLSGPPSLQYAGANGPNVTVALTKTFTPLLASSGRPLTTTDVLPAGANDSSGLPLFYLVFGVVLASYLFAINSFTLGSTLPARGHWLSAAALSVLLGWGATLVARYWTHSITAHAAHVSLLLTLTSLGVSSGTYLCLRASKVFGSMLATIVMIILGNGSGGVVPGSFLPAWLAALRPVLPMGAALGGIRNVAYFAGTGSLLTIGVLAAWAIIPLLLAAAIYRRRNRGRSTADMD